MKYKNIRNNARSLYRKNFKLYILMVLVETIALAVNYTAGRFQLIGAINIIGFCAAVLTYPVTLGCMAFFYGEYLGGHGKLSDIFRFYRDTKQLVNAFVLGVIMMSPGHISTACDYLLKRLGSEYSSMALLIQYLLSFLIGLAVFIFFLRTYPVPYIFGLKPQMKPFSIIKTSFDKTKGYVLDYILFSISVIWPYFLAVAILTSAALISGITTSTVVLLLICVPLFIFFMPYLYLCMAGFSSEIINNGGEI